MAVRNLGLVAFGDGDLERATELVSESLSTLEPPGDPWFVSRGLQSMASILAAQGDYARAARLRGAGEALRGSVGAAVLPYYQRDYDEAVARVCAGLGSTSVLSPREREVLDLLARGLSNRAIAQELANYRKDHRVTSAISFTN